jgi:hypothetical protein
MSRRRAMPIVDEFIIGPDGLVTAWACAINDLGTAQVRLHECAAPRQECARGFTESFACRSVDRETENL